MVATRQGRGKRRFLDSAWAVKVFARLTELSWSDVRDTCVSSRHFFLARKAQKITEYRDTAPLIWPHHLPYGASTGKLTISTSYCLSCNRWLFKLSNTLFLLSFVACILVCYCVLCTCIVKKKCVLEDEMKTQRTAASACNCLKLRQDPPWGYFSHLWSLSLNFFLFERSWKKMKNDTSTFVRMHSGDHLGDAKMSKKGTSLRRI